MYKSFLRPVLFWFSPERVHHWACGVLKFIQAVPPLLYLVKNFYGSKHPNSETELFGIKFPNKVGLAAGFDKEASVYNALAAFGFGHIEVGTVNPIAQPGNPKPRLFRLKNQQSLINRMGFNNPGLEVFVKNLRKRKPKVIIGANIGKNTATPNEEALHDYVKCFDALHPYVDYFVVNVSCPNIKNLGKLQDKSELLKILSTLQEANALLAKPKPVLLKISPDLNKELLDDTLDVVAQSKLDGIIATNTTTSREGVPTKEAQHIGNGGLSGKLLKEKSTETIRYIHQKTKGRLPIIGVGGIMSAEDAKEKMEAGASLVQVYTGFIYKGPSLVKRINAKL